MNGQQVIDVDLDKMIDKAEKLPGIKRKSGYIGFQDHGDPIALRHIQVLRISQ